MKEPKQVVKPTQAQLIALGLSQPYASQLLSGKRMPRLATAIRIQNALGYPVTAWEIQL